MSEEEDNVSGRRVEGEGGGEISYTFVRVGGRGRELDGVESGPRHIGAIEGVEIGELLEGGGLRLGVGGFDLAADLIE